MSPDALEITFMQKKKEAATAMRIPCSKKIKYFQKGSAHIIFKRPELVDKLNDIIAKHFPSALPSRI
ncbi:hypothetical protein AK51_28750 [Serratia nematodiphila DZ0503SBS1]|nr:hypothetical protein AK51_28750 [Serratia nematodiphila DZ0503SBS1]